MIMNKGLPLEFFKTVSIIRASPRTHRQYSRTELLPTAFIRSGPRVCLRYGFWIIGLGLLFVFWGVWEMGFGFWDLGFGLWDLGCCFESLVEAS